ncbi:DUF3017 domain-containing protein [Streptomyces sp. ISL-86]|nr:DUF3017 domain-containing protein [Streptomyces sp. ISL-86]
MSGKAAEAAAPAGTATTAATAAAAATAEALGAPEAAQAATTADAAPAPGAPEPDPDPKPESKPVSEPRPVSEPKPVSEPRPVSGPKPVSEPRPVSGPKPVSEPKRESGPEPESGPKRESGPEPESGPKQESNPESEPESEPGARKSRRFPSVTQDTARPEGGGRAAPSAAPAPARQWPMLAVLAATAAGLLSTAVGHPRVGCLVIGVALMAAAVLRRVLPSVGMLAVRSRFTDMVTYGLLGVAITLLALVIEPKPWLTIPFLTEAVRFTVR